MSLLLTLEQGPRSQAVRQTELDQGELVIGRSAQADWQIDDPDMFVSRSHCRITSQPDGYFVTDMSSSGLFVDGSAIPLGSGNSARLQNGMRLRLGDYVICVALQSAAGAQETAPHQSASQPSTDASRAPLGIGRDDFFAIKSEEEAQSPRPADLPNPFDQPAPGAFRALERGGSARPASPTFDDPFSLDPVATPASHENTGDEHRSEPISDDPFGPDPVAKTYSNGRAEAARDVSQSSDRDFGFDPLPASVSAKSTGSTYGKRQASLEEPSSPAPWELPSPQPDSPPPRGHQAPQPSTAQQPPTDPTDRALRAAFLRGMGIDDAEFPARDAVAEMEKFGREYRIMMEGLMQLLRKRAEEKGNARVAQTVVGASEVNPLKFLPSVDDALVTILAERSPGFLPGEAAIADAVRDLAHHHVRAWRGLQGALRRMIDRFDPAAIEEELKSSSTIETLLSGGRGAKLWELYQKRHREIATSAESRFMGEIGADFRDAYEEE
jgi:type VI secretion system protein ImpI